MSNELVAIENLVPEKVFVPNGLSAILDDVTRQIKPLVFDISTEKGRKEVASVCYRIKRTKTAIDNLGKDYVSKLKEQPKVVDAERKRARDTLEALEIDVRQPLTEWEEAEKKRVSGILERINAIDPFQGGMISIAIGTFPTAELKAMEAKANDFIVDDSLDEYKEAGAKKKEEVLLKLAGIIAQQEKREAEQAELERLRLETAKREQAEREARIAQEAAERARKDAEAKAEQERKAVELKAEAERQEAIRRERELKDAAERAERERIALEERAKREQEIAVKAERERLERLERDRQAKDAAEKAEAERKAANKAHRAKINNRILAGLESFGISESSGKQLIEAIVKGKFPNVSINY